MALAKRSQLDMSLCFIIIRRRGDIMEKFLNGCHTKDYTRGWFIDTFTVIMDLVQQFEDELFATFEIRVANLVDYLFNSDLTQDQIFKDNP